MLQKAYQYGVFLRGKQKKARRRVRKGYWEAEGRWDANLHNDKDQNGERHPKPGEVLLGNEGFVPIEHWEARLQSQDLEGEEGRKPLKSWRTQEEREHPQHQIPQPSIAVRERGPEVQGHEQAANLWLQENHKAVQRAAAEVQALREVWSREIQWDPGNERAGSAVAQRKDHQVRQGHPQSAARTRLDLFQLLRRGKAWGKATCYWEWWRRRARDPADCHWGEAQWDIGYLNRGRRLHLRWQDEGRTLKSKSIGKAQRKIGNLEENSLHRISGRTQHLHYWYRQQMQIRKRKGETLNARGKVEKIARSKRRGRARQQEEEERRGEEGRKGGNSDWRRRPEGGPQLRLQGWPSFGGRLFGWLDERKRRAQEDVRANYQKIAEAALLTREERPDRKRRKEVLVKDDSSLTRQNLQNMESPR